MVSEIAGRCAKLLSWASADAALQSALDQCDLDRRKLAVRGMLAEVPEAEEDLTQRFLRTLAATALETPDPRAGAALARRLVEAANLEGVVGPRRSLVGSAAKSRDASFEIALSRDNKENAMSIFLVDAGRKVGYALCRVDGARFVLRGAFVAEAHRGNGLSKLLLATFVAVGRRIGASSIETDIIDKPLLAIALASSGFRPRRTKWAIRVVAGLEAKRKSGPSTRTANSRPSSHTPSAGLRASLSLRRAPYLLPTPALPTSKLSFPLLLGRPLLHPSLGPSTSPPRASSPLPSTPAPRSSRRLYGRKGFVAPLGVPVGGLSR